MNVDGQCHGALNFPKDSRMFPSVEVKSSFKNSWLPSSSKIWRSVTEILSFHSLMKSWAWSSDSKVELTFFMSILYEANSIKAGELSISTLWLEYLEWREFSLWPEALCWSTEIELQETFQSLQWDHCTPRLWSCHTCTGSPPSASVCPSGYQTLKVGIWNKKFSLLSCLVALPPVANVFPETFLPQKSLESLWTITRESSRESLVELVSFWVASSVEFTTFLISWIELTSEANSCKSL